MLWLSGCAAQDGLGNGALELRNIRIPVYLDFEPKPVALFQAERVYGDHQRRGFFKIGLLRLVVLEKLSLEVFEPARLSAILQSANDHVPVKPELRKAIEAHDFSLWFAAANSGRLTARRVHLEQGAAWSLEQGTLTVPASAPLAFQRATLITFGPQSGELVCETTNGPVRLQLLALIPKKPN